LDLEKKLIKLQCESEKETIMSKARMLDLEKDLEDQKREKEFAVARGLDLQAQLGPLQQRVNDLQGLSDDIPNIQQSLEYACRKL
jgi:hypothetical protein